MLTFSNDMSEIAGPIEKLHVELLLEGGNKSLFIMVCSPDQDGCHAYIW